MWLMVIHTNVWRYKDLRVYVGEICDSGPLENGPIEETAANLHFSSSFLSIFAVKRRRPSTNSDIMFNARRYLDSDRVFSRLFDNFLM